MSFSTPSSFFETLVENATGQSKAGSTLPASFHGENPSGFAVAHLNKADVFVDSGEAYCSVLFEVVTFAEWGFVKSGQPAGYLPLPDEWNPVLIELERARLAALLPVLGLTEQNFEDGLLAEGAWFGVVVERYLNGAVSGTLYSEWGEEEPTQIQIPSGALIALPAIDADGFMTLKLPPEPLHPFDTERALGTLFIRPGGPSFTGLSQEKAEAVTTSDTVVSVGVMDIGTGGCNMLIADDRSVFGYFDAGLPTNMHRRSMPVALLTLLTNGGSVPAPQYYVLLSHWDWDHWYLGRQSGLTGCQWIVPGQPIGGKSGQFSAQLRALGLQKIFDLPFDSSGNIAVARCVPDSPGAPPAWIMNNSGLAAAVQTTIAVAGGTANVNFLMTADANMSSVRHIDLTMFDAINAVHHGSVSHGASKDLPTPRSGRGAIAYSYGIKPDGSHPYGFPVPAAVGDYVAASWGPGVTLAPPVRNPTLETTAQGIEILTADFADRGNIIVGATRPPLGSGPFSDFPSTLQIPES